MTSKDGMEIFGFENVICAPVVHSRYYFALWVQQVIRDFSPEIIAVEFPEVLKGLIRQGIARLPNLSVVCSSPDGDEYSYIPIDPCDALIHAVRIGLQAGLPVHFIDLNRTDLSGRIEHYTPDDYVLPRIGPAEYFTRTMEKIPLSEPGSVDYMREQHMAARLRGIKCLERRVLYVCGMLHWPRVKGFLENGGGFEYFDLEEPDAEAWLANLHPSSAADVLEEIPAVAGRFEIARHNDGPDRNEAVGDLITVAEKKSDQKLTLSQKKSISKYLRNLAYASMQFTPDMVDLITAVKNIAGDEFAYEVWQVAKKYPYFKEDENLPTIAIRRTLEELDEASIGVKSIKIRRRQNMAWKRNMKKVAVRRRPPEKFPNEWRLKWNLSQEQVSYPPEDILLEDYNNFLRGKVLRVLSEEKARTVEFTTSFLDGIDMRETIRNSHTGKIYVRDVPFIRGGVGPVTIIFDEDHPDRYLWRTVWYAEHDQESDLLMYTDIPGGSIIGPGISRCRFGGYTSIFPARRIANFWDAYDDLRNAGIVRNEADLLLYAAIYYSDEKYVAYVAAREPSRRLRGLAESYGRHVVYIPINSLSPDSVEKLQRFHVLGSRRLRSIAHRYIF
ncbi:MAG TPA: hypothetical protein PLN69_01790 [bacterium]|nr:hypothetical protein [bacterium]